MDDIYLDWRKNEPITVSNPFIVTAKSELLWWMEILKETGGSRCAETGRSNPVSPESLSLEAAERNESKVINIPSGSVQQGNPSAVSVGNIHTVYISS